MKKLNIRITILAAAIALQPIVVSAAPNQNLYLQVRASKLRAQPQFFAPAVADLSYGAALVSLGAAPSDKSWMKVKSGDVEGYLPLAAVTTRRVILNSSGAGVGAGVDRNSVVLAGKGFNRQVENAYAASKKLDFSSVDAVEKNNVDLAEGAAFIRDGGLNAQ